MTYDLTNLKARFEESLASDKEVKEVSKAGRFKIDISELGLPKEEAEAFIKKITAQIAAQIDEDLSSRIPTLEELERRGFKYGTADQSWFALGELAQAIAENKPVPAHVGLWLLNGINISKPKDPHDLLKNLGLVNPGRTRKVNKFDIASRMGELVDGGMLREHAALQVAKEFDCSRATALHWYKFRKEIYDNSTK